GILGVLRECITRTRAYAQVPDLAYAVRGGRLPNPWRWLAARLPLSFVVSIGAGASGDTRRSGGQVRGRRVLRRTRGRDAARIAALLGPALRDARPDVRHRIAIAHGNCAAAADRLRDECLRGFPGVHEVLVTELGPVFGVHGGPGTLALA